jgi:hypothetical protein
MWTNVSCHPWGRQHTTNSITFCDDHTVHANTFYADLKQAADCCTIYAPPVRPETELAHCVQDVIKIPYSWMIRFEKMSVFNSSSQINIGNGNKRPAN